MPSFFVPETLAALKRMNTIRKADISSGRGERMPQTVGFWQTLKQHAEAGHLRKAGTEMLVGAVVMLIAGMLLMGSNLSELHDIGLISLRSSDALTEVAVVDNEILGIELTLRSYAIKPRKVYAESFANRVLRLKGSLDKLTSYFASQPVEKQRLQVLRDYIDRRTALYTHLLTLRPEQQTQIADTVTDLKLRDERQNAQQVLEDIRNDALIRVAGCQLATEQKVRQSYVLSLGIVAFAFLLAAIGFVLLRGEIRRAPPPKRPETTPPRA